MKRLTGRQAEAVEIRQGYRRDLTRDPREGNNIVDNSCLGCLRLSSTLVPPQAVRRKVNCQLYCYPSERHSRLLQPYPPNRRGGSTDRKACDLEQAKHTNQRIR